MTPWYVFAALPVGLLAGAHISTWGMFKDAPHEGFTWRTFARSILLGAVLAPMAGWVAGIDPHTWAGAALLFGLTYGCERAVVEFHKTFLREEDQSKYSIPMQFHVLGRVVHSRAARWSIGFLVMVAAGLLALWVRSWGHVHGLPTVVLLVVGSAAGWVSAIGGAWKDAPIEGFEPLKFLRSPAVAAAYAFLLSRLGHLDAVVIAIAALGYTVATTETYKTFFFPSRPRGKFAGKPILYPEMLRFRQRFVPLYTGIWAVILLTLVMALRGPGVGGARLDGREENGRANAGHVTPNEPRERLTP